MEKNKLLMLVSFIASILLYVIIQVLYVIDQLHLPEIPASLIPNEYVTEFVVIIPGPIYTDLIILYLLPFVVCVFYIYISPYLVHILYKLNKITFIFRTKPEYGILDKGTKLKTANLFYRVLIVSFFAFGTSGLFVRAFNPYIFRAGIISSNPTSLTISEGIFFGAFFFTALSLILFVPSWLLEDSGLMVYRSFKKQRKTPLIEGVHKWYSNVLEIYTGFSVIIGYFLLIFDTFKYVLIVLQPGDPAFFTPIILIFLPLITTGYFAIPLYYYEKHLPKIQKRIRSRLEKINITEIKIPSFDELADQVER